MKNFEYNNKILGGSIDSAFFIYEDIYDDADELIRERMKRLQIRRWRKIKSLEV